MRRSYSEPVERGFGAWEFLGFLFVAAVTAWAFLAGSMATTKPLARVVSMQDVPVVSDQTASIGAAAPAEADAVPLPTPRPDRR